MPEDAARLASGLFLWTQRIKPFENINRIGQLVVFQAQRGGSFGAGAVCLDLADLVFGQAIVVE